MVTGRKYSYKRGDWKNVIQPITNRLCEEYGLSIVAAEYSKDPVNMNRKQWKRSRAGAILSREICSIAETRQKV